MLTARSTRHSNSAIGIEIQSFGCHAAVLYFLAEIQLGWRMFTSNQTVSWHQTTFMQVWQVANRPQAADIALQKAVQELLKELRQKKPPQPQVACIISDDKGFRGTFQLCKDQGLQTVAIGSELGLFKGVADDTINWELLKLDLYSE